MRAVAIVNQKGGVGKTTTSANLCHALAESGKKVTVIDLDPQGHLAISLGIRNTGQSGIDEVLMGDKTISQQVIAVRDNLQLIVSGKKLREIEQLSNDGVYRGDLLKNALQQGLPDQDFVFIDCPPSSGLLVVNALFAVDEILIPMTSDFLALQGLSHLMGTIKRFEKVLKKHYRAWLVISRHTPGRKISRQVLSILLKHFPEQILETTIKEATLLAECPSFGKTILEYSTGSSSAREFRKLAVDFIEGRVMHGKE